MSEKKSLKVREKSYFADIEKFPSDFQDNLFSFADLVAKDFSLGVLTLLLRARPEYEEDIQACFSIADKFLHDYREMKKNA